MVAEMMVALMAMIAACVLEPGEYFAINTKGTPTEVVAKVSAAGFPVTEQEMQTLATNLGESTMFNRAGGAPTFAVGMAHMFARVSAKPTALALWYHFAIMFEALFILTTIDAGTRVGRFLTSGRLGSGVATARQYAFVERELSRQRFAGRGMGLVFVSRRHRSSWRNQLTLAAVWPCQSVAVGNRALSWHDAFDQNAQSEIYLRHACAVRLHVCGHFLCRLPQSFFVRSKTWFFEWRAITRGPGINSGRSQLRQLNWYDRQVSGGLTRWLPSSFSCSCLRSCSAPRDNGGNSFAERNESLCTKTSLCRLRLRSSHSFRFNTNPAGDDLTIPPVGERTAQALLRHRRESVLRDLAMRLRSRLREDQ